MKAQIPTYRIQELLDLIAKIDERIESLLEIGEVNDGLMIRQEIFLRKRYTTELSQI